MHSVRSRSSTSERLIAVVFLLAFVTPLVGGQILWAYPYVASGLSRNGSSGSSNGIINGDFETGDFTGWTLVGTPPYVTIIDYNKSQIYDGDYSAFNHHYYESFYQNLNVTITGYSVFSYAIYAVVAVGDSEWHEIQLTVTKTGLSAIYLHYRVQGTQPADTVSDKYFLVGTHLEQWCAANRPVKNDLVAKGITEYLGGTITNITCQQGGNCCTVYDSLALLEYDPLSGPSTNAIANGGFEFQNFTEWTLVGTPPYVTIIDYNRTQVYEGFFSAHNHHYYESFYQNVDAGITNRTEFGAAMLATVSVSDTESHEIILTVDEAGLATVLLHYTIQASQPSDVGTDKYFLIGSSPEQWYVLERNVWDDLTAKGLTPNLGWRVSRVTCLQYGRCCTVYDSLRLQNFTSSPTNAIPNGDFEDPRVFGFGGYAVPYGWTTENHGGLVDSRNTNVDSFTGSRCWEMSTTYNGWKNIWYYFDGAGAPDVCSFAIKIAQGSNDNDIIQVKIKDLTETDNVGANVELQYEFGHGSLQVYTNSTYRKVLHEQVDYGTWYNKTKQWKIDWQSAYGNQVDMTHYWALLLAFDTRSVYDAMVARFDAVWMENLTHPQHWCALESNFGFEDARVHSGGAGSFAYGWTSENHGGLTNSSNTAVDSYEGSRCWEMSSGPGSAYKNLWYCFINPGVPNTCTFALKLVQGTDSADIVQVKIKDLTMTAEVGSDVELIYEFGTGSQQVWANSIYRKNIHEQILAGIWYNETRQWQADWQRAYGSSPNMSHYWALLLSVSTSVGSDQMIARFDAISLYNGTAPTGPVIDPTLTLIVAGSGLAAALICISAVVIVSARRRRADLGGNTQPTRVEREVRTPARGTTSRGHPSFCPYCGASVEGGQANYCPKCGANLQTA